MADDTQRFDSPPEFDPSYTPGLSAGNGASDDKSLREADAFANDRDLELVGRIREHGRHQTFRDHANTAILIILWVICCLICLGLLVFAWHVLTPASWRFLMPEQFDLLQTLLTSAILSSVLTGYASNRMK